MIKIILLAILFVACAVTEDEKSEPSSSASRNQDYFGSGADRGAFFKEQDLELTDAENRIIQDVFSPDYYEPNIILDYRYLKSGGRGYARSDGGQVLILPKRNQMPPSQNNFDALLEYLRLKLLEQVSPEFLPNSRFRINNGEENLRENVRENNGLNIRDNFGGNIRENIGGNMGRNMMRGDIRENIRGNMNGNLRQDRRDSGYRNEKLDQHDIEKQYRSDAELGSALYNH